MRAKIRQAFGQHLIGRIKIVGIQPGDDFAGRHAKSLVDRAGLPVVFFADPAKTDVAASGLELTFGQATLELPKHFDGSVGRAAIDDDVVQIELAACPTTDSKVCSMNSRC